MVNKTQCLGVILLSWYCDCILLGLSEDYSSTGISSVTGSVPLKGNFNLYLIALVSVRFVIFWFSRLNQDKPNFKEKVKRREQDWIINFRKWTRSFWALNFQTRCITSQIKTYIQNVFQINLIIKYFNLFIFCSLEDYEE